MGSSSVSLTFPIMRIIDQLKPRSILDLGCGTGRWGFIFRERIEMRVGKLKKDFKLKLDAVECDSRWITPIHKYIYDTVHDSTIEKFSPLEDYDLIFMSDVLEHIDKKTAYIQLKRLLMKCKYLLVSCPFGCISTEMNSIPNRKEFVKEYPYELHKSDWIYTDFKCFRIAKLHVDYPNFYILLKGEVGE